MTEDQVRAIVRDEIQRDREEEAQRQTSADYYLEQIHERRRKREVHERQYQEEERRRLEDRVSDLEDRNLGRP
jgi:hypothetical protein